MEKERTPFQDAHEGAWHGAPCVRAHGCAQLPQLSLQAETGTARGRVSSFDVRSELCYKGSSSEPTGDAHGALARGALSSGLL